MIIQRLHITHPTGRLYYDIVMWNELIWWNRVLSTHWSKWVNLYKIRSKGVTQRPASSTTQPYWMNSVSLECCRALPIYMISFLFIFLRVLKTNRQIFEYFCKHYVHCGSLCSCCRWLKKNCVQCNDLEFPFAVDRVESHIYRLDNLSHDKMIRRHDKHLGDARRTIEILVTRPNENERHFFSFCLINGDY